MTSIFDDFFFTLKPIPGLTIAICYQNLSKSSIEYTCNVLKISILDDWQGIKYTSDLIIVTLFLVIISDFLEIIRNTSLPSPLLLYLLQTISMKMLVM